MLPPTLVSVRLRNPTTTRIVLLWTCIVFYILANVVSLIVGLVYQTKFIVTLLDSEENTRCDPFSSWMTVYVITRFMEVIGTMIIIPFQRPRPYVYLFSGFCSCIVFPYGLYLDWKNKQTDCEVFREFIHIIPMFIIVQYYICAGLINPELAS